jgi:glucosamine--fructose-6-phosphate aminotransferase (isomerizing)
MVFLTHAGPEVGVASTKAFTTQLASLLMLALALGKRRKLQVQKHIEVLQALPDYIEEVLKMDNIISNLALMFEDKQHAIFLGRGINFPLALEGALKLKEISYIHAEAYPGGELKHGPLALVDKNMPVVVIAPPDHLLGKILSNIEEVYARGGQVIVITVPNKIMIEKPGIKYLYLPDIPELIMPMAYVLPMQLLAYHVAVLKGTDVDHPRNLAKSVTVE